MEQKSKKYTEWINSIVPVKKPDGFWGYALIIKV